MNGAFQYIKDNTGAGQANRLFTIIFMSDGKPTLHPDEEAGYTDAGDGSIDEDQYLTDIIDQL
jgi:hypothetical protein